MVSLSPDEAGLGKTAVLVLTSLRQVERVRPCSSLRSFGRF